MYVSSLHVRTHLKKNKIKICTCYQSCCHNEEDGTYGIRAGSTHDLGFATAFVTLFDLVILLLIELIVCMEVIMDRQRRGG